MNPNNIQVATSNIDVSIVAESIKWIVTILGSGAAFFASIAALKGVNTWKREFQGKKKIELAEEALTSFYQVRDAIRRIRNPFSDSEEGKSKIPESLQGELSGKNVPHIYKVLERFEKEEHIFNKISAMRYRFMAIFGNDSEVPFEDIRKIINDIFSAAQMYGMHGELIRGVSDEKRINELDEKHLKDAKTIWNMGKNDLIEPRVNKAIEKLEAICRPIILEK